MYAILRFIFMAAGGASLIWAIILLFGQPLNSLLFFALSAVLFYVTRFIVEPEQEEAPPPDMDVTVDYRKELVKSRKERQADKKQPEEERDVEEEKKEEGR